MGTGHQLWAVAAGCGHPWLGEGCFRAVVVVFVGGLHSVAAAPVQSQLKPEAELSLAKAQPELPSDGSHISANSGSS